MKIIVDAYNLLHAIFPGPRAKEKQKQKLIDELRAYARNSGNQIMLVFDGGDFTYPYVDEQKTISIVWAGHRMSADDWIMEYLDKNRNQDLLVASSDREIQAHASDLGIVCMGAYRFYKTIMAKRPEPQKIAKDQGAIKNRSKPSDNQVDELMENGSDGIEIKQEDIKQHEANSKGKNVSKRDRTLLRQLKKL